jgi:hypothetical protein
MIEHARWCSCPDCTLKKSRMTEQEAAERLCTLLNEIEEAGYEVSWADLSGGSGLVVGREVLIAEPPCEDEPWEVRGL